MVYWQCIESLPLRHVTKPTTRPPPVACDIMVIFIQLPVIRQYYYYPVTGRPARWGNCFDCSTHRHSSL